MPTPDVPRRTQCPALSGRNHKDEDSFVKISHGITGQAFCVGLNQYSFGYVS
jgi:hypothetical protein